MAHSINLTELNAALGEYCREKKTEIFDQLLFNEAFQDRYLVLDAITDETPLINTTVSSVLKPADPENFNPTNDAVKFVPRMLKVRGMKVDVKVVPQLLYKSWLSMGKAMGRADATRFTLEEFFIRHIIGKANEDLHLVCLFGGVYNAAGTTPADCMNGFLKIIADEETAGNITVAKNNKVATGAISQANIIDKFELIHDTMSIKHKQRPSEMKVGDALFTKYIRACRAEFGTNMDYKGLGNTFKRTMPLEGTNCTVVLEPGLGTSQRVICTPKENLLIGSDSMSDNNQIETEKFERTIKFMMDFALGVQIARIDDGGFVVNDQA